MTYLIEERSLEERLQRRVKVEQEFARTGQRFRKKSFVFRHERIFVRPILNLALRATGLYRVGVENTLRPEIRQLSLEYPNLPSSFDGFRILHLSDLHIDQIEGLVEAVTQVLKDLPADLCVITGDYRFEDYGPCEEVYSCMRALLPAISSSQGVYGILGNHDVSEIAYALEDMGVRMLINEAVEIREGSDVITLAGVDDPFDFQTDDLPGALTGVPRSAFKILLAHSPELYREAAAEGVDLYLCGHTHAGQIRFPLVGSLRHNSNCPKEYSYGHWKIGKMNGYTSPGVGSSGVPVRFNCPPEIVSIELRRSR
jgi:predicted MPP superfamily phosphohydrolase